MKAGRAVAAGVVGGVAMTTLGWLVRRLGLEMNAEMMLGTVVSSPGLTAWLIGFGMHLMISALIALAYAWGFEHVTHRAGAAVGLGFAVIHVVIAGMVMAMIPAMHPIIPEQMPAPGPFMANMGAARASAALGRDLTSTARQTSPESTTRSKDTCSTTG
jgi:hypothetical protein